MKTCLRIFTFISLLFLGAPPLFAQQESGQIHGTITDATTGEALIGANITLKGTSLGAASDVYGAYRIPGIAPGSYTLSVRFIGYKGKDLPVQIQSGASLEQNFALTVQAVEGQEVVITAQAQGQRAAINQQLMSNTIINVVSAEKIHQLPDENAATALSRLPGVSLMNGDQIVIRGVEAKLNQVLINGVELPSTDMSDRSTNLGFISSNMLSGIEVVKALTPDLDANAIGGVVNLRLREAPENPHFDVLAQGNYNSQDHVWDNHKFWFSASDRFFDNKLGVFLQANADRSDVGNQSASASYGIYGAGAQLPYGQAVYEMNSASLEDDADRIENNGGSLILDYKLPNGNIVFQNTIAHTSENLAHYINTMNFSGTPSVGYTLFRNIYGKDLLVNSLQAENSFGDLKVQASLSHSYSDEYTKIRYGDPGSNFQFQNVTTAVAPYGYDATGNPRNYNGQLLTLTMNNVYSVFDNLNPADADSASQQGWVSMQTDAFHQHLYNASLDLSMPVTFSDELTATFKAGGKFVKTTRTNDPNKFFGGTTYYNSVHNFFPGVTNDDAVADHVRYTLVWQHASKRGSYFLSDEYNFKNGFQYEFNAPLLDSWMTQSEKGWSTGISGGETWHNDFNGSEAFSAGYVMGTFDLFSRLTLIAGLRYEFYNMNYNANFTYVTGGVYGDGISTEVGNVRDAYGNLMPSKFYTVDRDDNNVFPDALLKYKVNDWSDVRFAYTNGISRPDYLAIIPKTYFVQDYNTIEFGNPILKATTVQNFDLGVSFYSNEIGLFTVGGFTKKLDNVNLPVTFYYEFAPNYNIPVPDSATWATYRLTPPFPTTPLTTTVNNNHPAYVKGLEFDWQTNFWYLPKPLNSLVLNINYTKCSSEMDYHQVIAKDSTYLDSHHHSVIVKYNTDTVRTARLLHQPNDILNTALGIDYKGFSGRISFNLQGNVINYIDPQGRPETDQYTGDIYRWDFTIKQQLPIEGLSIALNGLNIFHNPIYTYQKFRRDVNSPITENLQSVLYAPTIFEANLRYSF
ncbi:MAG TPA: TonB-dependent receptor [Bacteroidota bacterium]|nr:TonB-dependent receptor [Bacteroidota bacterium]